MSYLARLSDGEVEALATDVLRREMADFPFERAVARAGRDHEDEPSLFITAEVGPGVPTLNGHVFARIHGALHDALLARGDERFPFFSVRRADDETRGDDDETSGL